jgi:dimethylargininase
MPIAIVREISASMSGCELSFVPRAAIDIDAARRQHAAYQQALVQAGCRVIVLPAEDAMPDAVFVEDVAVVLDEAAVMTRPGAESRRGEGASVAAELSKHRRLLAINAPGTLDGGDVMRLGRMLYVGQSARSNAAGAGQLRDLIAPLGYGVVPLPMRGCLHLKSAVTGVADDTLLVNPDWVDPGAFAGFKLIEIDPDEPHAANALRVGETLIYPDCFPRTQARLQAAGIKVHALDVSELQKAEGAVTCCSLVFAGQREQGSD